MAELASLTALGGVLGDTFQDQEITRVFSDGVYVWAPTPVTASDIDDTRPIWLTEPTDSGAAAAASLTWLDPAGGYPAASANDVIQVHADVTIGGDTWAAGSIVRAEVDTPGGVDADWSLFVSGASTSLYSDDGTLTGNRSVDSGGNTLDFEGDGRKRVIDDDGTNTSTFDADAGVGTQASATNGTETSSLLLQPSGLTAWRSTNGAYYLGDVSGNGLPTLNSDGPADEVLAINPINGSIQRTAAEAYRVVPVAGAPVDGTTVAYYVGQLFFDTTGKALWEATAQSTNPDAGATGSTFAQVPFDVYYDRDSFGVRTSDPDPAEVGKHYTLTYGAGGSGFTLPPLANADIGDIITFTNTNGETVTVAPNGGEILNGIVNNNTVTSETAGEFWRIEKVSATEWLATELTPQSAVEDEFNSASANPTSTDATLTFAAGDLSFNDPLSVETWFANQTIDASSVGGSATQSAVQIDNGYTLLILSGPTAITDSEFIIWFEGLANGDTIEPISGAFNNVTVEGAGTIAAGVITADGTGLVGFRASGADGINLSLSGGTMHFFGEIPAPAADNLYESDGTLTGARTVTMDGNDLELVGDNAQRSTVFRSEGFHDALQWRTKQQGFIFGAGTFTPDLTQYGQMNVGIADSDVGDLTVAPPTIDPFEGYNDRYEFSVGNTDTVARNVVFDTHYKDNQGNDLGIQVVEPGTYRHWNFHYESGLLAGSYLDSELVTPSTAVATVLDSSAAPVVETLPAATGSGAILFYSNEDVASNSASLAPASGEQLNGVVDGTFLFSNYAAGTQFRADDIATGQWVVSVVGASTETSLAMFSMTGDTNNSVISTTGDQINLSDQSGHTVLVDTHGMLVGDELQIPTSGLYSLIASLGTNNTLSANFQDTTIRVRVNGVEVLRAIGRDDRDSLGSSNHSLPQATTHGILQLDAGDVVTFHENNTADVASLRVSLAQLPTHERVLAGMVTPEAISSVVYSLSADASGLVCPFDEGQGDTSVITNSAGTITLPAGKKYKIIPYASRQAASLDYELYDVTNGVVLERYSTDPSGAAGVDKPYYLTTVVDTDIQIREGNNDFTVTWNGRDDGFTSFPDALKPWSCFIDIEQLPVSTVVLPDALTPEVLHRGVFRISSDWTNPSGNNAWQAIQFDSASHDTAGGFTPASYSYTVPADGDYHTDVVISYRNNTAASNDPQRVAVRLNGTSELLAIQHDISDQLDTDGWLPVTLSGLLPGLTTGDVLTVEVFDADDAMIHLAADSSWSIQQQPTSTVIDPGSVPVEQLSTVQVSFTGTVNDSTATHYGFDETLFTRGSDLTLSGTGSVQGLKAGRTYRLFASLQFFPPSATTSDASQFRFVDLTGNATIGDEFDVHPSVATHSQSSHSVSEAFFTPTVDSEVGIDYTSGTIGELSARSVFTVQEVSGYTISTISETSLAVDDQTASGYFDLGTMRMQWGRSTTAGGGGGTPGSAVVTFPAAFAATPDSIQTTCGVSGDPMVATYHSETPAQMTVETWKADDRTGSNVSVSWYAIGLKP
ncbi:MAG: hypothetical protein ACRBK7_14510 [Acidimicrobiales bacterium]